MKELLAYVSETGEILADSTFLNEDDVWWIALGWPDKDEIEAAKKRGARVIKVKIQEISNDC